MFHLTIEELLDGKSVESQKLEFKLGWDGIDILHTITAFATDFHNEGGGYLIIGVEEQNGQPKRPVHGIESNQIDKYQKEFLSLINRINPDYTPSFSIERIDEKLILVIKCFRGDNRPYDCPVNLSKGKVQRANYIRKGSNTIIVRSQHDKNRLEELRLNLSFDQSTCQKANIDSVELTIIHEYLESINSTIRFDKDLMNNKLELLQSLNLTSHPSEFGAVKNAAILLFNSRPHEFFPAAKLEIVHFSEVSGRVIKENEFSGPIFKIIVNVLSYLKNNVLETITLKSDDNPRSRRIDNYPYIVLRELIVNAMYHQGYNQPRCPVISIFQDRIEIINYPAPLPPLTNLSLKDDRITGGDYRNIKLGEFLKEYGLAEKRATGIPTIKRYLRRNNSPDVFLEMDDEHRTFFKATIFIHQEFVVQDEPKEVIDSILSGNEQRIIELCMDVEIEVNNTEIRKIDSNDSIVSKLIDKGFIIRKNDKILATKIGVSMYLNSY